LSRRATARQSHAAFTRIGAHRHVEPYATLVLAGSYREAGESGRWQVEAGMVVVHAAGEAHADWFGDRPTDLIDFVVPASIATGVYRCADADSLARSVLEGTPVLGVIVPAAGEADWPDELASALRTDPAMSISGWAAEEGLQPETVSRGFLRAYGVTPAQYRLGVRIKGAIASLTRGAAPLAEVAYANGFADQPHMTRAVKAAIGTTPAELRRVNSVQDRGVAAL
jgi:AraC-like DNA-binding protein